MPLSHIKPALARTPRLSTFDNKCPIKFITDRLTLLRVWVCLKQCPLLGVVHWYISWDMLQTLCAFQHHKHYQHYKHNQQYNTINTPLTFLHVWLYADADCISWILTCWSINFSVRVCTVQLYSTVQYSTACTDTWVLMTGWRCVT